MSGAGDVSSKLRQGVWNGSIPLEIRLHKGDCRTYDESEPYLIQFPRLSYLGLLTQKLHTFFSPSLIFPDVSPSDAWLTYEDVPLKWHYPLGLLYDLYSGAEPFNHDDAYSEKHEESSNGTKKLPWKLTLHFSDYPADQLVKLDGEGKVLHDLYMNSVKEADYLRNGTGKTILSLNIELSQQLWRSIEEHDAALFHPINQKLLNPTGVSLRHIPMKFYLPHASSDVQEEEVKGSLRVVQALVTPNLSSRQPQTIGTALNSILPTVFPSRRIPMMAQPVLHGAVVPMGASVEELLRVAGYADGWLHVAVVMMG